MSAPGSATEASIDQRVAELEATSVVAGGNPFAQLLHRMRLRDDYERVAADYLSLLKKRSGTPHVGVKVLEVLEMIRARDVGIGRANFGRRGPQKRQRWDIATFLTQPAVLDQQLDASESRWKAFSRLRRFLKKKERNTERLRTFRSSDITFSQSTWGRPNSYAVDLKTHDVENTEIIDFSNVLVLHLGFVGQDLVVALDSNLELFIYGPKALASDRRVRSKAFADYGYYAKDLYPEGVVYGPIVRPGIRHLLISQAEQLHDYFEQKSGYPESTFFLDMMRMLDTWIGHCDLMESIQGWADTRGCSMKDIFLVIVPDEALYLLPLSFLGASSGQPLLTTLGGVSNALSLLALKWAVMEYHWTTQPNLSANSPRCTFFAANGTPPLDLTHEMQAVSTAFNRTECTVTFESASRLDFLLNYSAGDVCWFAGHGSWDASRGIDVSGELIPFPLSGPSFSDGVLTNWDLLGTPFWNFQMLWLTVMNCCVLGRSIIVGPNPLGFLSSMHSRGSVALIAALWPVLDDAAISFAEHLSREVVSNFGTQVCPRSRALSEAVRKAIGDDKDRQWLFAPYALWGLP